MVVGLGRILGVGRSRFGRVRGMGLRIVVEGVRVEVRVEVGEIQVGRLGTVMGMPVATEQDRSVRSGN